MQSRISFKIDGSAATRPGRPPQIQKHAFPTLICNDQHTHIPDTSIAEPLNYFVRPQYRPNISVAVISASASPARQPRFSTSIDGYVAPRTQCRQAPLYCISETLIYITYVSLKTIHIIANRPLLPLPLPTAQHNQMDAPTVELMSALASYVHAPHFKLLLSVPACLRLANIQT